MFSDTLSPQRALSQPELKDDTRTRAVESEFALRGLVVNNRELTEKVLTPVEEEVMQRTIEILKQVRDTLRKKK